MSSEIVFIIIFLVAMGLFAFLLNRRLDKIIAKNRKTREDEEKQRHQLAIERSQLLRKELGDQYEHTCQIGEEVARLAGMAVGNRDCPEAYNFIVVLGYSALRVVQQDMMKRAIQIDLPRDAWQGLEDAASKAAGNPLSVEVQLKSFEAMRAATEVKKLSVHCQQCDENLDYSAKYTTGAGEVLCANCYFEWEGKTEGKWSKSSLLAVPKGNRNDIRAMDRTGHGHLCRSLHH